LITIYENIKNYPVVTIPENEIEWYCGAVINSVDGFGNYIITDNIEDFTLPTNDNFQEWYQIKDFQDITDKIKYIRPVKATLENTALIFNGTAIPTQTKYSGFYNPTVAETTLSTLTFTGDMLAIAKNPKSYADLDFSILVCFNPSNYTSEICVYDSIDDFDSDTLTNDGLTLKTWKQLFPNQNMNNYFLILILEKSTDDVYVIKEKLILSKTTNIIENIDDSEYIYLKIKSTNSVDTTNINISNLKFADFVQTIDFTNTATEITNAIEILKADGEVKGFLSIEFDNEINIVGESITEDDTYFNFVSLYDLSRYKADPYNTIVADFITMENGYFTQNKNNTIVNPNMYQKYDIYNKKNRFITVNGIYAGLLFKYGLIKVIDFTTYNATGMKLLWYPSNEQRNDLKDYQINTFFKKKEIVYIYGNRNTHEKET